MGTKSKFFRVFTEGDSADGRVIERKWIEQMAATFNPTKYGARVWLEHIRGILPDSPFKAYGDVTAVKAEEVEIDGKKKLALFAQIDATPELIAMNKARQKVYTSVEIDPDFAKSGQCYLVGLGVTDSPASLGTEMLAFAAGAKINPLESRKQRPENLFTAAHEAAIEFEPDAPTAPEGETLFAKIKTLLGGEKKDTAARFADVDQAVVAIAASQKEALDAAAAQSKAFADLGAAGKTTADALADLSKQFAELKAALDKAPDSTAPRPSATGGDGTIKTDC